MSIPQNVKDHFVQNGESEGWSPDARMMESVERETGEPGYVILDTPRGDEHEFIAMLIGTSHVPYGAYRLLDNGDPSLFTGEPQDVVEQYDAPTGDEFTISGETLPEGSILIGGLL